MLVGVVMRWQWQASRAISTTTDDQGGSQDNGVRNIETVGNSGRVAIKTCQNDI